MAQRVAWLPRQAVTSVVTKQPAGVALVRMSRYASWYAQKAMAQAMQVQAVKLSKVYTLRYRAPAVLT